MAKEKVLHDPIRPKYRKANYSFVAPTKEQATTGRFMPPGDDYGTGFRTPVGKEKAHGLYEGPIPFGCVGFEGKDAID